MLQTLQNLIHTLPFHIAIDCVFFFMFLTAKYVMRIKSIRSINLKTMCAGFVPFLNFTFILWMLVAILSNLPDLFYELDRKKMKRERQAKAKARSAKVK